MPVPTRLRSERLLLRCWRPEDAVALHPVLVANRAHLAPWIPARVAEPVPPPELARRLAGFAADFAAAREWRYALLTPDESGVLGEVGLYPRAAGGRVPFAEADHVEIGYWLRADVTGRGLATEAARAALDVAAALPRLTHVEIRCDARNAPSAAVPRRLGFTLARTVPQPSLVPGEPPVDLQVWILPHPRAAARAARGADVGLDEGGHMADQGGLNDVLERLVDGWCERRALRPLAILLPAYADRDLESARGSLLDAVRAVRELGRPALLEGELAVLNEAFALLLHDVVEADHDESA